MANQKRLPKTTYGGFGHARRYLGNLSAVIIRARVIQRRGYAWRKPVPRWQTLLDRSPVIEKLVAAKSHCPRLTFIAGSKGSRVGSAGAPTASRHGRWNACCITLILLQKNATPAELHQE